MEDMPRMLEYSGFHQIRNSLPGLEQLLKGVLRDNEILAHWQ